MKGFEYIFIMNIPISNDSDILINVGYLIKLIHITKAQYTIKHQLN